MANANKVKQVVTEHTYITEDWDRIFLAKNKDLYDEPLHALKLSEDRLNLSQIQKQMESLITFDKSLKEKISPILASMQFEDMMRQKFEHLERGYDLIMQLEVNPEAEQIDAIKTELEDLCSSQSETTEFYEEIKKEKPPKGIKTQGLAFKI